MCCAPSAQARFRRPGHFVVATGACQALADLQAWPAVGGPLAGVGATSRRIGAPSRTHRGSFSFRRDARTGTNGRGDLDPSALGLELPEAPAESPFGAAPSFEHAPVRPYAQNDGVKFRDDSASRDHYDRSAAVERRAALC